MRMFEKFSRILATGVCFAFFGIGGIILRIIIFPSISLFIWHPLRRQIVSRRTIASSFMLFIWFMKTLGVFQYRVKGLHRLKRKGLLVISNHPSLIDTIFLMSFMPTTNCIVKQSLWHNPYICGPVRAAQYIKNSESIDLIDNCIATLKHGENLIIFPEGTRTPTDNKIVCKRGAANIAIRGQLSITPIIIDCFPRVLEKNTKWWQVPNERPTFNIRVMPDINVTPFIEQNQNEVMAVRALTRHIEHFFNEEMKQNANARKSH